MSKQYFITATGTDIGKTYYLEKLCANFKQEGQDFFAIKPIISGFDDNNNEHDSALILKSLGLQNNKSNLDKITPWRFKEPLSPNVAAKIENKEINFDEVVEFCKKQISTSRASNQNLLIEGAGGVMTPINDTHTYLDLICALKIPVILVTGNYLGTISHTLSALKCMQYNGIEVEKIALNTKLKEIDVNSNLDTLLGLSKIKVELI